MSHYFGKWPKLILFEDNLRRIEIRKYLHRIFGKFHSNLGQLELIINHKNPRLARRNQNKQCFREERIWAQ